MGCSSKEQQTFHDGVRDRQRKTRNRDHCMALHSVNEVPVSEIAPQFSTRARRLILVRASGPFGDRRDKLAYQAGYKARLDHALRPLGSAAWSAS